MNKIIESVRRDMAYFHRAGLVDDATFREFEAITAPLEKDPNADVKPTDQSV